MVIDEKTEKKLGENLSKKEVKEVKQDIQKQVDKKVEVEIKKRLGAKLYEETKKSAFEFQREFRKQLVVGITAAFGFLIALSWRTPIEDSVNFLVEKLGLKGGPIYWGFVSAIVVTIIAVTALIIVTKWEGKISKF